MGFTSLTIGTSVGVSGGSATFLAAGTCTIQASQQGNPSYAAASTVSQSFLVHHVKQTINFNPIGARTAGTPVALVATASSTLPITFASTTPTHLHRKRQRHNPAGRRFLRYPGQHQAGSGEYFAVSTGQKFSSHPMRTRPSPSVPSPGRGSRKCSP